MVRIDIVVVLLAVYYLGELALVIDQRVPLETLVTLSLIKGYLAEVYLRNTEGIREVYYVLTRALDAVALLLIAVLNAVGNELGVCHKVVLEKVVLSAL